jgi:acyl-coenzyme A synthetase/AMP-(fatty) acid ligase
VVLIPEADALFPAAVVRSIRDEKITTMYMVPSTFVGLMTRGGLLDVDPKAVQRILYAGEAFAMPQLRRLREWAPKAQLSNLYGPIETNVCTFYDLDELERDADAVPIGGAIDGVTVELWDETTGMVPAGEVGEICVHGPCVTPGYWGDATLTASKRATIDGQEWFRTGDLATRDEAGRLWFRGRRDHLIKSRGFRIELGEIEAALLRHPAIAEAAVAAVPDPDIGNALFAWYVAAAPVETSALKSDIARQLPAYMLPRELFAVPALPKTNSGKISRRALVETLATAGKE